jgi:hypothetical protein
MCSNIHEYSRCGVMTVNIVNKKGSLVSIETSEPCGCRGTLTPDGKIEYLCPGHGGRYWKVKDPDVVLGSALRRCGCGVVHTVTLIDVHNALWIETETENNNAKNSNS